MRLCYITNPFEEPLSELQYAVDNFGGVELSLDFPNSLPEKILPMEAQIKDILESTGLARVVHVPCYLNLAEIYPSLRRANMDFLRQSLECAHKLDFGKIVFHAGFIAGLGRRAKDSARSFALEGLAQIEPFAKELSLELCLENNPPTAGLFSTPEEIGTLLERFDFKFVLDAGHMHISGFSMDKMPSILKERLSHIHLHDNFADYDKHLPLGVGTLDYPSFISQLKRLGYDSTITLEVFSRDREYLLLSKKKLESLL